MAAAMKAAAVEKKKKGNERDRMCAAAATRRPHRACTAQTRVGVGWAFEMADDDAGGRGLPGTRRAGQGEGCKGFSFQV